VGVGGMVHLAAQEPIPNGKGILVTDNDVTLDHIEFSGAAVADQNGAGIRYEHGNLTIKDSYFHNNQEDLLGANDPNGHITITNSQFAHQSSPLGGYAHQIYVGMIAALDISDSYFQDNQQGHHIKSRAAVTDIHNSVIDDGSGTTSYEIDVPKGGVASIHDNVIVQGPYSANSTII